MDESQLETLIDQYRAGLEAEITILYRLQQVAKRQHEASDANDMDAFNRAADDRDSLMSGLVNVEGQLRDVRKILQQHRERARRVRGYQDALEAHHHAIGLVAAIVKTDEESTEALAKAERARRDAARAVEQGETTLSAYRRVMTAPPGAALVDRRG